MSPADAFQQFIKEIANRIEKGGTFDEAIVDVVLAQHALRRALIVLLEALSDDRDETLDIPDGWPPE